MKKINEIMSECEICIKLIRFLNKSITIIIYVLYPLTLIYLYTQKKSDLNRMILVPLIGFIVLSVFRKLINRTRPYIKYNYEPILNQDNIGESFPSRHTFSIFIITYGIYTLNPSLGIVLLGLAFILAMMRFIGGVHYLSDVLVAAILGILAWFI